MLTVIQETPNYIPGTKIKIKWIKIDRVLEILIFGWLKILETGKNVHDSPMPFVPEKAFFLEFSHR